MRVGIQNLKWSLTVVALLLFGCEKPTLPPGGFAATAALDKESIHVGDSVLLTLTARHPAGSVAHFPTIGDGKKIVVSGRTSNSEEIAEGVLESEEIYHLTSFRLGDWTVTTNTVTCTFADGTEKVQQLPKLTLHVETILTPEDADKLSDIRGIVKPPLYISPKIWVPLLVALLAIIAGLITLIFLRKPRTILNMPPPEPPHVIARRALSQLKNKDWMPEPFFTELSLILRTYLEKRFDLNAPDSTTEELTREMAGDSRLKPEEQQNLQNFMTQADLVKFARAGAEKEVMQNAFETVEQFIDKTCLSGDIATKDHKELREESV